MARRLAGRAALVVACGIVLGATSAAQLVVYELHGDSSDDHFGNAARAGDVDGDGVDDLIVGNRYDDENGHNAGSAAVYSGADGTELFTLHATSGEAHFGYEVGSAGDLDGDGHADLLVGAPYDDAMAHDAGSVTVHSGADGSVLFRWDGTTEEEYFGVSVSGGLDVDGDGVPDVVVGSSRDDTGGADAGRVIVYSGADGSVLHAFPGLVPMDALGTNVLLLGDLDGDGRSEIAASASDYGPADDNAGAVVVWSGATGAELAVLRGDAPGEHFGYRLAAAGDHDGDGVPDLLVSSVNSGVLAPNAGSVRVHAGAGFARLLEVHNTIGDEAFGLGLDGAGDVDGDGVPDLAVGAPRGHDPSGARTGRVLLLSGATGDALAVWYGSGADDRFGSDVALLGDLDGDGRAELGVYAPTDDDGSPDAGSLLVLAGGAPGAFLPYGTGHAGAGGLVPQLAMSGQPWAGGTLALDVSDAAGGAAAVLCVGLGASSIPVKGGATFLVAPMILQLGPLPLAAGGPGQGALSLQATLPPGPLVDLTFQVFVIDPGTPGGPAATAGRRMVVPAPL